MKLKRFFERKPDDPMGALNDLSFLLIIYFLVIAGFNANSGFLLNLPSKNNQLIVQNQDLIKLSLTRDGRVLYRGEEISHKDLESLILRSIRQHPNMTVFVSIHPDTEYQNFVNIIDMIRLLHVENFSFRTEKEETGTDAD